VLVPAPKKETTTMLTLVNLLTRGIAAKAITITIRVIFS
jgi:hypothetical protein